MIVFVGNMKKNEWTPEGLLWNEMAKTRFSKGLKDIDLSHLNVGDIIHLTGIAIHTLPDGDKCCVCKSEDGKTIPPAILLRPGIGIKYTTKDFEKCAWELFDMIMSASGLALIVEKKYGPRIIEGRKIYNYRFGSAQEIVHKKEIEEERKRQKAEEKRLEQYRFNSRNRHWRDNKVLFREEDHIYIVDGTPLDSVTTFVKNCFPMFDSEFHAKRKAEALGITKEAVLEMWEKKGRESREQGTAMHEKIESYYLGKSVSTDETFELFKIFANKIALKPYRTEWAVYDWEQKIAGTIDFVDYQNGEYIIYDWKRSDKLIAKNGLPIKNSLYGEKALPPIDNLDDSPYYHYALQLSLYKYILEKNYGITVSKLRLGIFHPSYKKPYVLEMPYLQNEIDTLFGLRSEVIF